MKKIIPLLTSLACALALYSCKHATAPTEKDMTLYPFNVAAEDEEMRIGYVGIDGKVAIQPQFFIGDLFVDGRALVCDTNHLFGFIDEHGTYVIPSRYADAMRFSEGLEPVSEVDGPCAFIDTKGETKLKVEFADMLGSFRDGLAVFMQDGKLGYIDKSGKIVVPAQYDHAGTFHDGLAKVAQDAPGLPTKYGYINTKGELQIGYQYDSACNFHDGLAVVGNGDQYGFIDNKGKVVIPLQYSALTEKFADGLCAAAIGDRWGAINKKGEWVIKAQYVFLSNFAANGLAVCVYGDDHKKMVINKRGERILEKIPPFITPFYGNYAITGADDRYLGVVDSKGIFKIQPRYQISRIAFFPEKTREYLLDVLITSNRPSARFVAYTWLININHLNFEPLEKYAAPSAMKLINALAPYISRCPAEELAKAQHIKVTITHIDEHEDYAIINYTTSDDPEREGELRLVKDGAQWLVEYPKLDRLGEEVAAMQQIADTSSSHLLDDMPEEVE